MGRTILAIGALTIVVGACAGTTARSLPTTATGETVAAAPLVTDPATSTTTTTTAPATAPATTPATTPTTVAMPPADQALPPPEPDFSAAARRSRMLGDLAVLLAFGPRESGTDAERFAAMYLERELAKLGLQPEREPVPLPNGRTSANVWATVGDGGFHVLIGAHYDTKSVSPGGDDNGSGTVIVLELARRLAAVPPPGVRATFVFFGAEEILDGYGPNDHHYGSRLMAARLDEAGELPDFMMSIDGVGVGSQLVAASFRDANPSAAELLQAAGSAVDVRIETSGDISDHEAFARAGVPAVLMWRPGNPAYHSADDDHVDPALMAHNLEVVERLLSGLGRD